MSKSKMPVRKWSAGRGTLWIIAAMFMASAAVRLSTGTGQAIAQEMAGNTAVAEPAELTPDTPYPLEIASLLADLADRQEYLDNRERHLEEFSQSLAVSEQQVRQQLAAMVAAEAKLAATIATSETAAESDLARLTSVYENMKPKQASVFLKK